MAWAQGSDTERAVFGNKRVNFGTFSQASGDTGGAIVTGLDTVEYFNLTAEVVTTSDSSGTVTVTTQNPGAAQAGYWIAIGT